MASGNQTFHHLSQIFTASTFRKIIHGNDDELFKRNICKNLSILNISSCPTNLEVIRKAYKCLNNNYRNEYFYKNALFNSLIKAKKLKSTVVLNELRVDRSIADTVFVNGEAVLYEIKTELDTPDKLLSQIDDYRKAFSKIFVVTHKTNFYKYYQTIKGSGVGLVFLDENNDLIEHTPAIEVNDFLDHIVLFKLLRKAEYTSIVKSFFGYTPNVPNTLYFKECLALAKTIPIKEFQRLVMLALKNRIPNESLSIEYRRVPQELRYICHTLNLKPHDLSNLFGFLSVSFKS